MTTSRPSKVIREDIAVLETELKIALAYEVDVARAEVAQIMEKAGITAADLFGAGAAGRKTRAKSGKLPVIRYRDNNGHTWSGQGRMPGWLKNSPNPEQFRV